MTDFEETTSFGAWRGGGRARERAVARLVLLRLRQKRCHPRRIVAWAHPRRRSKQRNKQTSVLSSNDTQQHPMREKACVFETAARWSPEKLSRIPPKPRRLFNRMFWVNLSRERGNTHCFVFSPRVLYGFPHRARIWNRGLGWIRDSTSLQYTQRRRQRKKT